MTSNKSDIKQNRGEAAWITSNDFTVEIAERVNKLLAGVLPEFPLVPNDRVWRPTVFLPYQEFDVKYQDWVDRFVSSLYLPRNVIPWLNGDSGLWEAPVPFAWFDPMWWRLMLMQGRLGSLWSATADDSTVEIPLPSAREDFHISDTRFSIKDKVFENTIGIPRLKSRGRLSTDHPLLPAMYNGNTATIQSLSTSYHKNAALIPSVAERPSSPFFGNRPATPAGSFIKTIIQKAELPTRRYFSVPVLSSYVPVTSFKKPYYLDSPTGITRYNEPDTFLEIDNRVFQESLINQDIDSGEYPRLPMDAVYLPGLEGLRIPGLQSMSTLFSEMRPIVVPDKFLSVRKGIAPSLSQEAFPSLSVRTEDIRSDLDSPEFFTAELETGSGRKAEAEAEAAPYAANKQIIQGHYTSGQDEAQDESVLFDSEAVPIVLRSFQNMIAGSQKMLPQQALAGNVPMNLLGIVAGRDTAVSAASGQTGVVGGGTSGSYCSRGVELALAPIARSTRNTDEASQSGEMGGEDSTAQSEEEVESAVDAQQLAVEVYDILKRRLLIERERAQATA